MQDVLTDDRILLDKRTRGLVKSYLPPSRALKELADFFSALADTTRIKIVSALTMSKMCVGDISALLELNQTTVSHQLKILRSFGIVDCDRQGKIVFYYIKNHRIEEVLLGAVNFVE